MEPKKLNKKAITQNLGKVSEENISNNSQLNKILKTGVVNKKLPIKKKFWADNGHSDGIISHAIPGINVETRQEVEKWEDWAWLISGAPDGKTTVQTFKAIKKFGVNLAKMIKYAHKVGGITAVRNLRNTMKTAIEKRKFGSATQLYHTGIISGQYQTFQRIKLNCKELNCSRLEAFSFQIHVKQFFNNTLFINIRSIREIVLLR